MNDLLDDFFRFPKQPGADDAFVTSILGCFTAPAIVLDRRMRVRLANPSGKDMLARFEAESPGAKPRRDRQAVGTPLPAHLRDSVRTCIRRGKALLLPEFPAPGVRSDTYDLILCPGEVQGSKVCFLLMLRPYSLAAKNVEGALTSLFESINACGLFMDRETRFRIFNRRHLEVFGIRADEIRGKKASEINPSRQAPVLESQVDHLMSACKVLDSKGEAITTARRGVLVAAVKAWPVMRKTGESWGLMVLIQPGPRSAPLSLLDERTMDLFGQTSVEHGPPMFFTHLDGKIITMNLAARDLTGAGDGEEPGTDLQSAVNWVSPTVIDRVYDDLLGGLKSSVVHADVETPAGRRIFLVQAVGLTDIGDFTSSVLVHFQDVTDLEHSRNILARTARRLATEKEILGAVMSDLQTVRLAYVVVDRDLNVIRVSDPVMRLFDKGADFFIGKKLYEVEPAAREKGIVTFAKTAMEHGQPMKIERTRFPLAGRGSGLLSFVFRPMIVDGKEACLIGSENLTEVEADKARLAESSQRLEALMENLQDGVAVLDRTGTILDVNPAIYRAARMAKEDMVGKNERETMLIEEGGLVMDFRRRAMRMRRSLSTGCIKLTSKVRKGAVFADLTYVPILDDDGAVKETLSIIRHLTDVVNLEKKVEEYTSNLERIVQERTSELAAANQELENAVTRLASMAKSGLVLGSLKDLEAVMDAFVAETKDIMAADFVSVVLITSMGGGLKTTYYSVGASPPSGAVPSELIERNLAAITLGRIPSKPEAPPAKNLLIETCGLGDLRGLLVVWKEKGEFSVIDFTLARLLCTQLGFAIPVTSYVKDLRRERDRSRSMRRVAYRTAGSTSVGSAIGIVAEELSRVMTVDRFFWLVSKDGGDIWVSEVLLPPGAGLGERKHTTGADAEQFRPLLEACSRSHSVFCNRFPDFGREGFASYVETQPASSCSFADPAAAVDLTACLKRLLQDKRMIGRDEGSLALAPVMLSRDAYGLLCAYNEMGVPFTSDESCLMCQAASTVGHMWQAADAASSIRRLKAEGQTLSEIAHDLKYPLMRIRHILTETEAQCKADGRKPGEITTIGQEIDNLNVLVDELMDISDIEGRQPEILDLCEIVDGCISLVELDAASRSVTVTRRAGDPVPPPVFAHRQGVKNIIINILANAVEAAGSDGRVDIWVTAGDGKLGSGGVSVVIADSGPGLPEELVGRVFDPFYTTKPGGRGLGLFSAKKRANANGGDVTCEIGDNGKVRFVISLPLAS